MYCYTYLCVTLEYLNQFIGKMALMAPDPTFFSVGSQHSPDLVRSVHRDRDPIEAMSECQWIFDELDSEGTQKLMLDDIEKALQATIPLPRTLPPEESRDTFMDHRVVGEYLGDLYYSSLICVCI